MRQPHSICSQYVRSHDPDDKCAGLPIRSLAASPANTRGCAGPQIRSHHGRAFSFLYTFTFAFARNPDLRTHPNQVPERA